MTSEDPNIATLREALNCPEEDVGEAHERGRIALDALASTLAERDLDIEQRSADQIRLRDKLAAYQRTFGPLLIGAEPVKCLGCYNRTERITELEATLAERDRRIAEQHALILDLKVALSHNTDELIRAGKRISALEAHPAPAPGERARLHCRECGYYPSVPINCAKCGANYCMTREPMPALNGGDDNGGN